MMLLTVQELIKHNKTQKAILTLCEEYVKFELEHVKEYGYDNVNECVFSVETYGICDDEELGITTIYFICEVFESNNCDEINNVYKTIPIDVFCGERSDWKRYILGNTEDEYIQKELF